ncbi:hypothetical protein [Bacillus paranthracis]|uniref:hypothetical protein n=1 Tax=Bacillus paranthracis TaxID=2026186 RepID=UPI0021D034EC|nr:hypothetical protein [Bacillus paranthracis]MCU5206770.1 hypothetical protein [Bacillus paranthracis]HDR7786426.1 hypothetical protein [Bacillus paranthracis]
MVDNSIKFNSSVASKVNSILVAVIYEELQWLADENDVSEIDYELLFEHFPPDFHISFVNMRTALLRLQEEGYGEYTRGNRGNRAKFKFKGEQLPSDSYIRQEYFVTNGTKRKYIHDIVDRVFESLSDKEKQESKLVRLLYTMTNGVIDENGIRLALLKLEREGVIEFYYGSPNTYRRYTKGFKFIYSVNGRKS